jgi:hypothetical protein
LKARHRTGKVGMNRLKIGVDKNQKPPARVSGFVPFPNP